MNAVVAGAYETPKRASTKCTAVEDGTIERSDLRLTDHIKEDEGPSPASNPMAIQMAKTRSQSAEFQRQQQEHHHQKAELASESDDVVEEVVVMTSVDSYARGQTLKIGTHRFPAPVSFDDVSLTDLTIIALIPWFDRAAVRGDAENEFSLLSLYEWDDKFYWVVSTDAISSRVWQCIIAVDDIDLANFVTIDVKRTRHVVAIANGLQTFAGGPLVNCTRVCAMLEWCHTDGTVPI